MEAELFGPLKRAHITQTVVEEGHWAGSVRGLHVRFDLVPLHGVRRVAWCARFRGWSGKGVAGTVFDAMEDIAALWARKSAQRQEGPRQQPLF